MLLGREDYNYKCDSVEAMDEENNLVDRVINKWIPQQKEVAKQTEQNYVQNLQQQQFPDVIESASTKYTIENLNRLLFNSLFYVENN